MEHGDTAVGQRIGTRYTLLNLTCAEAEIPAHMVRRVIHKNQVRQAGQWLAQGGKVVIGPDITVNHSKWRITEQCQRLENAATGFQRFTFR